MPPALSEFDLRSEQSTSYINWSPPLEFRLIQCRLFFSPSVIPGTFSFVFVGSL